jgi:hypothetical protein
MKVDEVFASFPLIFGLKFNRVALARRQVVALDSAQECGNFYVWKKSIEKNSHFARIIARSEGQQTFQKVKKF